MVQHLVVRVLYAFEVQDRRQLGVAGSVRALQQVRRGACYTALAATLDAVLLLLAVDWLTGSWPAGIVRFPTAPGAGAVWCCLS